MGLDVKPIGGGEPVEYDAPAGVQDAMDLHAATERRRLCALGYHAWTPWFQLPMGSFVCYCSRAECGHCEQYDQ